MTGYWITGYWIRNTESHDIYMGFSQCQYWIDSLKQYKVFLSVRSSEEGQRTLELISFEINELLMEAIHFNKPRLNLVCQLNISVTWFTVIVCGIWFENIYHSIWKYHIKYYLVFEKYRIIWYSNVVHVLRKEPVMAFFFEDCSFLFPILSTPHHVSCM